jgi:hypothetical protein
MEPDFDKLVSNNIRHTEQRLIQWNKQAVWAKVQLERNVAKRSYYFYYSAAAVILLLIYFGVQLIPSEVKPQVNDARIISGQKAKEPEKKSVIREKSPNQLPDQTVSHLENSATVRASDIPNSFRKTTSLVQQKPKHVDALIEPVVTDIEIQEKEFLLPVEVTVHEEKIRPIVGVITESHSEGVANVKQKKSLHKLKSSEPVPWENIPNALVFARKK